ARDNHPCRRRPSLPPPWSRRLPPCPEPPSRGPSQFARRFRQLPSRPPRLGRPRARLDPTAQPKEPSGRSVLLTGRSALSCERRAALLLLRSRGLGALLALLLLLFLRLLRLLDHDLVDLDLGQPKGTSPVLPALVVLEGLDPLAALEHVACAGQLV